MLVSAGVPTRAAGHARAAVQALTRGPKGAGTFQFPREERVARVE